MLPELLEQRFEQCSGFLLIGMSVVSWRRGGDQCQRVKDLALDIVGITFGEFPHRHCVIVRTLMVWDRIRFCVDRA